MIKKKLEGPSPKIADLSLLLFVVVYNDFVFSLSWKSIKKIEDHTINRLLKLQLYYQKKQN